MLTDRLFHNAAYKTLNFYSTKSNVYFYYFKAPTLNVLPIDPVWNKNYVVPVDDKGKADYKYLGVSHGEDVSKCW
jgi:hypothetical protein